MKTKKASKMVNKIAGRRTKKVASGQYWTVDGTGYDYWDEMHEQAVQYGIRMVAVQLHPVDMQFYIEADEASFAKWLEDAYYGSREEMERTMQEVGETLQSYSITKDQFADAIIEVAENHPEDFLS